MELNQLQTLNLDAIQDGMCVVAARHPMSALGEDMQNLSEAFEARGIFHLLLDFDLARFAMNLQRSGHARRFFLRKSREQGNTDPIFLALSRTDALFDCIAGGNWALANEIQELSPLEWMPAGEYEETYWYHRLIHAHVSGVLGLGDPAVPAQSLRRLEAVVTLIPDSAPDVTRLELCTRFLAGEEAEFWAAFEAFVEISGNTADAVPLADPRVFDFPWLAADRYVSIELLAWIALARNRGFRPPQPEYARGPSAAWINGQVHPAEDLFLELESQFGL